MATGGGPTMYKYHTPSGDKTMDGLSMALRRGLALRDMEMVQFHPTGLLAGDETKMTGTVLEEGLRGAGGYLLNGDNKRFMFDYDGEGERATRDIVSRAIYEEMRQKRTSPYGGVYISMSHLGPEMVAKKFQGMVKRCADSGFDLASGLVEVVPTAHYLMGGIVVDVDTRTSLPGLYVAGEDAGGAHGSNRLGGNGVANSTVYGGIAGDVMGVDATKMNALHDVDETVLDEELARAIAPLSAKPGNIQDLRNRLMNVMWDDVGVMRDASGIRRGIERIAALKLEMETVGVASNNLAFNLSWHDWLNLQSLIHTSEVIAKAGLSRENSRGAHFREDFPDAGPMDQSYFTVATDGDSGIEVSREAVKFTIVKPGESLLGADEAETLVGAAQ
jgi:fumarate reductase flavoprotein subunit